MAFENRHGGRYYYRKRRTGNRVVSEYVGKGELAECFASLDRYDRIEKEIERLRQIEFRARFEQIDDEIDSAFELSKSLVDALFLINGYRTHKGQWRKKRKQ